MKFWCAPCLGLLALLASSAQALGQTAAEAALRWGLLGTWKPNCATPTSRGDPRYEYVVRGAGLFLDRDYNEGKDTSSIPTAVVNRDGTIELTIIFEQAQSTRKNTLTRRGDSHIRVTTNYDIKTGEYSVRDGKLLHNGNEVPWQARCR